MYKKRKTFNHFWGVTLLLALYSMFWTAVLPQLETLTLSSVANDAKGTEDLIVIAETEEGVDDEGALRLQVLEALRFRLECVVDELHLVPHMWLLKSSSGKIARNANREKYLAKIRRS